MKGKFIFSGITTLAFIICYTTIAFSQQMHDSLISKYQQAKNSEERGKILRAGMLRPSAADSNAIAYAVRLLNLFKKENDETGTDYIELYLAAVVNFKGDYATALNMEFPILSRFEKNNDRYGMMYAYRDVGNAYFIGKDYQRSCSWYKKSIELAETIDPKDFLSTACNDIGVVYSMYAAPDSGLLYAQRAVNIDAQNKDTLRLSTSLSTVGENYMAAGEYDIAMPFLRKSFYYQLVVEGEKENYSVAYGYNDFAQAFFGLKKYDSTNYYALSALQVSQAMNYRDQLLRSYEYLYKSFDETKNPDSSNKYLHLAIIAKDSLFGMEKTRSTEAMNFSEQIRRQDLETEKAKAAEQRKENIQYALIAFGIISLIIIFLLLSRSFITNTKMIGFLGVLALLIVFEFLNLLLHPFLESITHHSPLLMLLALVCIAVLLVPLHHKLEHWATHKLVEKNKAIRLAAARKTIEKFGSENS